MIPIDLLVRVGGGLAFLAAIWLHGCSVGQAGANRKAEAAAHAAMVAARETETNWQKHAESLNEARNEEIRRINAAHAAAGLRKRPAGRLPPTAACTADGQGATGAQLSSQDAEAFAGLAADADRVAADLRACQAWIEAVK